MDEYKILEALKAMHAEYGAGMEYLNTETKARLLKSLVGEIDALIKKLTYELF